MIRLYVKHTNLDIELHGDDGTIIVELTLAIVRMLKAMEKSEGDSVQNNLATLILMLTRELEEE